MKTQQERDLAAMTAWGFIVAVSVIAVLAMGCASYPAMTERKPAGQLRDFTLRDEKHGPLLAVSLDGKEWTWMKPAEDVVESLLNHIGSQKTAIDACEARAAKPQLEKKPKKKAAKKPKTGSVEDR